VFRGNSRRVVRFTEKIVVGDVFFVKASLVLLNDKHKDYRLSTVGGPFVYTVIFQVYKMKTTNERNLQLIDKPENHQH
jgi:hypothetical protein